MSYDALESNQSYYDDDDDTFEKTDVQYSFTKSFIFGIEFWMGRHVHYGKWWLMEIRRDMV